MRNALVLAVLAVLALGTAFMSQPNGANAAFHLMRIYGVGGGAFGETDIQWVELRMVNAGQNFVSGTDICFFDAAGDPYARFTFPSNVANGADEASILVASGGTPTDFNENWAAGMPNAIFAGANTVALGGGATPEHPISLPAGKVSFGTDATAIPANMCQGSFTVIDSVAYGAAYPTPDEVDFGEAFGSDIPSSGMSLLQLQGPICIPGGTPTCTPARDNSANYMLVDPNVMANYPRNNAGLSGPITEPEVDTDDDGRPDDEDNCPNWPNPAQNLPPWAVPPDDPDCDGFSSTDEAAIGTDPLDNCANTAMAGDESDDRWPADFDDNRVVNTTDVFQVLPPNFGTMVPPTSARIDIAPNGVINTTDVFKVLPPTFGSTCT